MDQHQLILIVGIAVVVLVVLVVIYLSMKKRRSQELRERFGPEYDRVLKKEGEVRLAENVLQIRANRRDKLKLHPLTAGAHSDFSQRWMTVQTKFVDDPKGSVMQADRLVSEAMEARGYPMADFEQRAADLSVDHPVVVENYRAAHDIAQRHSRGQASTEDLRKAMVHYRSLFDKLLEDSAPQIERKEARA